MESCWGSNVAMVGDVSILHDRRYGRFASDVPIGSVAAFASVIRISILMSRYENEPFRGRKATSNGEPA